MGEIEMRGRAERVLTGPPGAAEMPPAWDTENQKTVPPPLAAVVSYRYETPAALRDTLRRYETGQSVELALYLLALESERGLRPVALLCCGLDGAVGVGGWQRPAGGLEIAATGCTEEAFRDLLDRARMVAARAAREIRGGRIDATADEPAGCEICAYRDVCRSGERTAASVEGAAL